ncbi:MAG: MIP/aquaporin family protein [Actinomycetota bacterium]|nr:MIP/aquaporin family protein [Actinomycetota bacterium]
MDNPPLKTRLLAEFIGTAMLLIAVVGSGIMAESLSPDDTGLQLLEAAFAAGFALIAIILTLQPISGAHINPAVTLAERIMGGMSTREASGYVSVQVSGAVVGTIIANLMFELPAIEISTTARAGGGTFLGEVVATFGLLLLVFAMVKSGRGMLVAFGVGVYIGGAYFFTSSTSFANPAVTAARTLTDTFTGITPPSALLFVAAQLVGVGLAIGAIYGLFPKGSPEGEAQPGS